MLDIIRETFGPASQRAHLSSIVTPESRREENDVVTDKTISEKSEEETTAGLNEASADSAAYNEPGFNTCPSMTAKSWNDQQRKNCLLDAMM
ncbi:hypothetical protein Tcan_09866 [Toxocara canis]|uniref:Uncharacterized protein n=1 Tax=Toxocara canis TaxID=6265 RepID=A0A0B2VIB8_TOXCA|nr:hypothetical protein Tcan_09866 [Toxocara canis]